MRNSKTEQNLTYNKQPLSEKTTVYIHYIGGSVGSVPVPHKLLKPTRQRCKNYIAGLDSMMRETKY